MWHLLKSDLAATAKEGMGECVARRKGVVEHLHRGIENMGESYSEGQERKTTPGGEDFYVGDRGKECY